jgi:aminoglycoside 3-N-acetyltransferase
MTSREVTRRKQSPVTTAQLVTDLTRLGLHEGATVLVHSSLSQLGNVEGGANAVIDALMEVVGSAGTLLFPTLTGTEMDGPLSPPAMDLKSTACWTGRIPETARHRKGARRSVHPTHSIAALGFAADRYAAGHETGQTPCDKASPYARLIGESGFILLLGGVTQESNTTLHCLEELAQVPYHLQPDITDGIVIDLGGNKHVVRNRLHLWGWERDFQKVTGPLNGAGAMQSGRVGQSTSHLISAQPLADTILPILEADPLYLLSKRAGEAFIAGSHPAAQ